MVSAPPVRERVRLETWSVPGPEGGAEREDLGGDFDCGSAPASLSLLSTRASTARTERRETTQARGIERRSTALAMRTGRPARWSVCAASEAHVSAAQRARRARRDAVAHTQLVTVALGTFRIMFVGS